MPNSLPLSALKAAVTGSAVAIRSLTRLAPIGGPADKVFPPTFGDAVSIRDAHGETHKTKYCVEPRRVGEQTRTCVLLDSVASQANRLEEALLEGWERGELSFPLVRVDFREFGSKDPATDLSGLGGDGLISALEAPHRISDAILRDSTLDGKPFRASALGSSFTDSSPANATSLYAICPHALVFGLWDSTGPKGGSGSKFQRALVSEVVGVGVEFGRKTASRIDPTGIEKKAGPIFEAKDSNDVWTIDPKLAKQKGKKPLEFKRGGDKAGSPAVINHGNVKPSTDPEAGGVTLDYAEQVTTVSLSAIRRLRFPRDIEGQPLVGKHRAAAEDCARTVLVALSLAAIVYQREQGFDFRSRCAFQADAPLCLEFLDRDGGDPTRYSLDRAGAAALLSEAASAAAKAGMPWSGEPVDLQPSPKLVALIRASRALTVSESDEDKA